MIINTSHNQFKMTYIIPLLGTAAMATRIYAALNTECSNPTPAPYITCNWAFLFYNMWIIAKLINHFILTLS